MHFIGAFGDDPYTTMLENEMKKYNVDISTTFKLKNIDCGQAYIFLMPNGDNSIIVYPSANAKWPNKLNDIQINAIKNADAILLQRVCQSPKHRYILYIFHKQ